MLCPCCKTPDAYDGLTGISCLNRNCQFGPKEGFSEEPKNKISELENEPEECSPYPIKDGAYNFKLKHGDCWYLDARKIEKLTGRNENLRICSVCSSRAGLHNALTGRCPNQYPANENFPDDDYFKDSGVYQK